MKPIKPESIEILDALTVEVLRIKTPAERLAIAFACNRTMRLRLAGYFETRHPNWSAEQISVAVAARMLHGSA